MVFVFYLFEGCKYDRTVLEKRERKKEEKNNKTRQSAFCYFFDLVKSLNKGLISVDRGNKGHSTTYNTPFHI